MKAMILAAGKGTRMLPLTLDTPKPLLKVAGKPLIEYHIEKLAAAGVRDIVINHAYLGEKIESYLGSGSRWGVNIEYSREGQPLETAGGIVKALKLLNDDGLDQPFIVINGDVWCDLDFKSLSERKLEANLAHVVLIDNPAHNLKGDFFFDHKSQPSASHSLVQANMFLNAHQQQVQAFTFAGISILSPRLFSGTITNVASSEPKASAYQGQGLGAILRSAMDQNKVTGEYFSGEWIDVGTPQRLEELNRKTASGA